MPLSRLGHARKDGSLLKLCQQLMKARLLVLDDWGVSTLTDQGRQDLLEIVDDQLASLSTAITSPLPVARGMHISVNPPWLMPFSIDRCTRRIGLH